jgi:hypothetical protein
MILTCPPSLSRSRLWAGLGVRWPSQSHPLIQGLPVLESLPFNSLSVPGSLPPLLPCLASHLRQGRVASVLPAPHPPIKGLPIPKSSPPIPSNRVVEREMLIGTQYSNLYTAVDTPAEAAWFVLSRFTTSSSRAARPQSPFLLQNAT